MPVCLFFFRAACDCSSSEDKGKSKSENGVSSLQLCILESRTLSQTVTALQMAPMPSAHARNGTATAVHSAQHAGRVAVTLCRAVAVGYVVLERGSGAESKENDLISCRFFGFRGNCTSIPMKTTSRASVD